MTITPIASQIKELVEMDEMLAALDNVAAPNGTTPQRAYSRMYAELSKLRESELAGWNSELNNDGPGCLMLVRCSSAVHPYHTDQDGPCEVYTENTSGICDLHEFLESEAGV